MLFRISPPRLSRILFGCTSLCCVASAGLIIGCGNTGNLTTPGTVTPPLGPTTLTVSSSAPVTNAQTFNVTISESGQAESGSLVLSSGKYASLPTTLGSGQAATITVPASLLSVGTDTLTATFTPSSGSSGSPITATSTVTVTSANAPVPVVTVPTPTVYSTQAFPFRALQTQSGNLLVSTSSGIEVFNSTSGGNFQYSCNNPWSADRVSSINFLNSGKALAATISNDGLLLYPSLSAVISCTATPTVLSQGTANEGSFEVVGSLDGKYAFVANEDGEISGLTPGTITTGNVGVVKLSYDANGNLSGGTLVGQLPTAGNTIAGLTLSHDGTRLYVTSEIASTPSANAGSGDTTLTHGGCINNNQGTPSVNGLLTVMSVSALETQVSPSAILSSTNAGCGPVRAVETSDSSVLFVSARGDNSVLAFSVGMLLVNPNGAFISSTSTGGTNPIGLALFDNDKLLAVANSDRFYNVVGGMANAAIISVGLPSSPKVVATIPSANQTDFPREFTLGQDGSTLFLTNYMASDLYVLRPVIN